MPYIKVVSERTDGTFTSLFTPPSATVKYAVGEWTTAPEWLANLGHHVTFFDGVDAADAFLMDLSPSVVSSKRARLFYCTVELPLVQLPPISTFTALSKRTVLPVQKKSGLRDEWPEGTVSARRIMLVSEVPHDLVLRLRNEGL